MTREELLELAALDAFGLLDEYEAALFTRSFHHAPAAVQDEIKELQAGFTGDELLLPDVEPDPGLRQRVLDAVSHAIEADSMQLAPLAMIGRARSQQAEVAGRIGMGTSGQVWRAAAFVLAGALLVVSYFGIQALERSNQLFELAINVQTQKALEEVVGRSVVAVSDDSRIETIVLRPRNRDDVADAKIMVIAETGEAKLLTSMLTPRATYTIVALNDDNDIEYSKPFEPRNMLAGVSLELTQTIIASLGTLTWEIRDASGGMLLTSAS